MKDMEVSEINAKTEAFDRLTAAVDQACVALERLADIKHGGLRIEMVGSVMQCSVLPSQESVANAAKLGANRGYKML